MSFNEKSLKKYAGGKYHHDVQYFVWKCDYPLWCKWDDSGVDIMTDEGIEKLFTLKQLTK